ncbi:MAG: penicillin-binding protein 2 [Blastocatellia bacterium]|nr:penicillin-binding protein 2 [Chloracidobacterium sp.]MBL8186230.1 penicillin-binding protein 2 [Blastocatellia bacterium]HRJ88734.1 penicillin-binding protein 2 [Pyrinomonadaceae bacterium]HRK51992.1 penicillin-binding protein 2 [Pyrinomonadaceae bacterium]
MKLNENAQNLGARIGTIQIVAFLLLTILGVRLYYLQVVKGDYYSERAENQRIRLIPIPAPRGAIFDRNGKILVDSRPTFNVVLSNEPLKQIAVEERVDEYAEGLNLEPQFVIERLNAIKKQNDFETLVLKDNASMQDIAWVEAHSLEYPELRIELQPQRFYPHGTNMAHVLGYVGEISPKQLESETFKQKGFRPGDIIGKGGLEEYYDEFLRGRPGYRKVIVDSRGRIQSEIEVVPPQSGQDLVSTIDLDLQMAAEQQLAASVTKRGTIIAMDPNNGELLALASWPSFDPNVFVQGSKTREGRKQIAAYWQEPQRPLFNRAIQGRYPPGSTWKIPESLGALQQGVITVQNSNMACGGGIQIGNKFTRCMGSHGSPPLSYAITKSCDGYYYRLALKMKVEGLIEMIEMFGYDQRSGIDLPNEKVSQTPKSWKPIIEKREGKWSDIRTVYASIGQDTVWVTPISMLRAVASIGAHGKMYVPHFLKEFKPISGTDNFEARPGFGFQRPEPKDIPMTPEQEEVMVKGMWAVVNGGGTAAGIAIPGFDVAGKTGTAQVAELGKDVGDKKDHAWFVSFAPAYKPEIAVIALIENVGFGGSHAAPAVKGVYEAYLAKRGGGPVQTDEIAKK